MHSLVKPLLPLLAAAVLGTALNAPAQAAEPAPFADPGLRAFMGKFERATEQFINGNKQPWLELAARGDDVTIMGGWGAHERGWNQVGPRYDWAAARFRPSGATLRVEYLASGFSGDLAYTVAIERAESLVIGEDQPRPHGLRVTHLFRKEGGEWKLIHRHADPLMTKTAPAAVFQR
jgi:ketosteroid isomerase-like protein